MENGEIDLIDLYSAFKKTPIYRVLNNAFKLITSNKIWFISFILIGIIAGYILKANKPPLYKSEMVIESKEIDNYVSQNMVSGLNSLIYESNFNELNKIGLDTNLSSAIKSLELIPSEIKVRIKNEDQNIFKLALYIYNTDSLKQIETILVNYLNNNTYSTQLKEANLKQYRSEKKELLSEVNELDSINTLIKNQFHSNQKPIYTSLASISQEKTKSKVRIIELERLIFNSDNYTVLNSFTPTTTPEPVSGKYPLKFALLSFILGFFILRVFKR